VAVGIKELRRECRRDAHKDTKRESNMDEIRLNEKEKAND